MGTDKFFTIFYFNNQVAKMELEILLKDLLNKNKKAALVKVNRSNDGFFIEEIKVNGLNRIITNDFENNIDKILKNTDFVFSIGGDGTLLFVSSIIYKYSLPLAGIYMGTLGFLTWFDKEDIPQLVNNLVKGNYKVEERIMLDVSRVYTDPGDEEEIINEFVCMNEVSLSKYHLATPLDVYIYVDNEFLSKFKGDGIIVSTPNGSTGYSLSAGGPIICPGLSSIIITPIAPHSFTMKPIIIRDYHEIQIYFKRVDKAYLTCDGQRGTIVYSGDKIKVSKSKYTINLIKKEGLSFFKIITSKLNWGGI
ncbi:MAG: NAD(+)/NADH kinase [Spirochaetes bacterium]|nr:NAD(+)/NADH kinase [Spirochaetota bacterium]